ncbi:MAG: leucine-rich repeat domain-containing protein [Acidobacteriota bacterium]
MNRNNLKQKHWLCLNVLIAILMVSITYGKDETSTRLIAYFMNGNNDALNSRVYLWNPSDKDGEVTVRVFTLPTSGGMAQELTTTPLMLGTLKAKSALNLKLAEDILVPLLIPLPYTTDGGNLTLEFTITTGKVQGTAQVFSSSFTFGTYQLRKISSISSGSPTVLVANFMNGNSDVFNSRVYLWNPSDKAGEVSARVFTLPLSGGTPDELTTTPVMLGTLGSESALNIKLAEDILVPLGIPLPHTTDGGNLTVEFTITAADVQGAAQVFSSDFAFGTYPLLEPEVLDCQGTVVFVDSKLESAVRDELGIDQPVPITNCSLDKLKADGEGIQDLGGLEFFPRLTELDLDNNSISDLTPLTELIQLTKLNLDSNSISNLTPLAGLTQLTDVEMNHNSVSDLSPLAALTELKDLEFENNNITNLTPLAGLTGLEELKLDGNSIMDISPLTVLIKLKELGLENNTISDISALVALIKMRDLDLDNNNITDLTPLAGLTQLIELDLDSNNFTSLTPLSGLTQLKELSLENNNISDLSPLAGLTQLMELDLGGNTISNLAVVAGFTQLRDLDLETNSISDISPLVTNMGLGTSDTIDLRNNLLDSGDCTNIQTLITRGATVRHDVTCP